MYYIKDKYSNWVFRTKEGPVFFEDKHLAQQVLDAFCHFLPFGMLPKVYEIKGASTYES